MVREQPSQISVIVQIILLIFFMVGLSMCLYLGIVEPLVVFFAVGFAIFIIYLASWANKNPHYFDSWHETSRSSNATLTCKNGHSRRVWVDITGGNSGNYEGFYDDEIIYNIEGHDVRIDSDVKPPFCPECGAAWLVPKKHNGHKR